ncbi:MAG: hypothetical protein U9O66_00330, partial [Patescibacteria group bacterium]|nr:hypothetical protein [Patescibacteria group bacterium]
KIFFYCALMELFFLLLAFIEFPLRKIFSDYSISPRNPIILLYLFFIFAGLLLSYFLIYKIALKNKDLLKENFKIIVFFFILFQITLLIIPPLGSSDIYNYIFRAKVLTHYHQNPFLTAPINFPDDPFFILTQPRAVSVPLLYGPLWLIISVIPTILSNNIIFLGILFFKLLAILFNIGTCFLIFKIIKQIKPDYKYLGTMLYGFNPLILFEIANNGHNDIAMMFFVVLSIFIWLKKKYYLSLILLICSVLIKFVTILLLPIFVLITLNKFNKLNLKVKFFINSIIIFCAIMALNYFLIGATPDMFLGIDRQFETISSAYMSFIPMALIVITKGANIILIKKISYAVFIILYLSFLGVIFFKKKSGFSNLIKCYFIVFLLYFLTANFSFMQWYFLWMLPFVVILGRYKVATLITTFALISYSFFIYFFSYLFLILWAAYYFIYKRLLDSRRNCLRGKDGF